ncbi:MAG: Crp/Fnr family transcriptional regulator [Myxococcales bacterium]|nr:Crp/Fnr family transcriptional regulator [Myxococcales bacterium]
MTPPASPFAEFLPLSADELAALTPYLRPVRHAEGAVLVREGDPCREVLVMTEGLVRCFYDHRGRDVNLRLLCAPAAVVPFASFVRGEPASETIEAVEPVVGLRLRLRDFADEHPGALAERIGRVLAERHYLSMERRLRTLQWKSAKERYDYFCAHVEPAIVQRMPLYHVASYLGVTPESLSRVRRARAQSRAGRT